MKKIEIISQENAKRLDRFLADTLEDYSRSFLSKLIDDGLVTVNNKKIKKSDGVNINDEIIIEIPLEEILLIPEEMEIEILYEDEDLAIINKEKGISVHLSPSERSGTLVNGLAKKFKSLSNINGSERPGIVHRLDKDTSGALLIAKNNKTHKKLQELFKNREISKKYLAIVHERVEEDGKIEDSIMRDPNHPIRMIIDPKGREALTYYKVLDFNHNFSLLELDLITGRTHQIRVHLEGIRHPILGDPVYNSVPEKIKLSGQILHAFELSFIHPNTGKKVFIQAPFEQEFKKALKYTNLILKR